MKPHKHPILFSVLALTLACLLLNASIIQVSAIEPVTIGIIVASIIGGAVAGWFAHDFLASQSESPGVELDSYLDSVADSWVVGLRNLINTARNYAEMINGMRLIYVRYAEYEAKNFVDIPTDELDKYQDQFMFDVAYDLYQLKLSVDDGIEYFLESLADYAKNRLTGDLENADIQTSINLISLKYADDIKPVYSLSPGDSITGWIWGSITAAVDSDVGTWAYDQTKSGTLKLIPVAASSLDNITISVDNRGWTTKSVPTGVYRITYSGELPALILARDVFPIADLGNIKLRYAVKASIPQSDGSVKTAIQATDDFVLDYTQSGSRTIYTSDLEKPYLNLLNNLDVTYDAAFNAGKAQHHTWRALGYTDPSQIPPDMVLPPIDVVFPTLQEMFENYTQNWEELYAWFLAYLQQVGKTLNESNYKLIRLIEAANFSFADVREKLLNVIIRMENGSLWAEVEELIPLWTSTMQDLLANQTNTLKGVIGALVKFKNGTVKYVEIPAGWQIIPGQIVTPSGSVPSLTLQNWSGGYNPAYTPGNYTEPTFVTPADETVQVTLQLLFAILPLILLLAVVNMITNLGRRR